MNHETLKNIYQAPPDDFHSAVLKTLYQLDGQSPARNKKRRRAVRIAVVCAAVLSIGTVSAVAAGTKLFGLLSEPVGKYGLRLAVENSTQATSAGKVKYYRPKLGYLPEGFSEVPHTGGLKYHDVNSEKSIAFLAVPADDFDYTEEYIIASEECTVGGNRLVLATRQITEGGEEDFIATEYFGKEAFVVQCIACNGVSKAELKTIFEHLSLEEYEPDFITEKPSYADIDQKRMSYTFKDNTAYHDYRVGEPIRWSAYSSENQSADFTVTVKSITEKADTNDIPSEYFNWMTDYSLIYDDYFDANGKLISSYMRTDTAFGDGIHTQNKNTQTKINRGFYLAEIEVAGFSDADFDVMNSVVPQVLSHSSADLLSDGGKGDRDLQPSSSGDCTVVCCSPGDEANMIHVKNGDKRTYIIGFVVDEDVLGKTCLTLCSQGEDTIDDTAQTITRNTTFYCVKVKE